MRRAGRAAIRLALPALLGWAQAATAEVRVPETLWPLPEGSHLATGAGGAVLLLPESWWRENPGIVAVCMAGPGRFLGYETRAGGATAEGGLIRESPTILAFTLIERRPDGDRFGIGLPDGARLSLFPRDMFDACALRGR